MLVEPVVLFFVLGLIGGLARSDLKIPAALYEGLSIYLLLAIGLKGGVELAKEPAHALLGPVLVVLAMGVGITLMLFALLQLVPHLTRADRASLAAHYGSVSVVTFAVAQTYLKSREVDYEGYSTVFLVLLEVPALIVGVLLARGGTSAAMQWGRLLHEVVFGKSILLLIGGLIIGWLAGPERIAPLDRVFFDAFKGVLAFFLLEMGLVVAGRYGDLRRNSALLITFGVLAPILNGAIGAAVGAALSLSVGGSALLATLAASASYIAAPAAMRIAVPQANPALSIAASLAVTFPFNIAFGIPLYHRLAQWLAGP
jgi:uncharacterized protein